jgi:excisionase family DNA binding protein
MIDPLADLIATRLEQLAADVRKWATTSPTPLPLIAEDPHRANGRPTQADATDMMMDSNDLAEIAGCHPRTLRRWVKEGLAPRPAKLGRRLRWRRAAVETWLKERAR